MSGSAPRPAAQRQPQQEESTFRKFIGVAQQVLLVYALTQVASRFFASKTAQTPPPVPVTPGTTTPSEQHEINPFLLPPQQAISAWSTGVPVALHVYLSTDPYGRVFDNSSIRDASLPHFEWSNITFGDWNEARTTELSVNIPDSVQHNGSLWADIFLTKNNASPDDSSPDYDPTSVHHVRKLLSRYLPKPKVRKERKLLQGDEPEENDEDSEPEEDIIASYWHQNLTLALVSDTNVLKYRELPPPVIEYVHLIPNQRDETGTKGYYKPIIFPNDFWHLRTQYVEINTTTPTLPLQIVFQPMSYFKFQMFATMTFGFQEAAKQQGGSTGAELDEVKRMLVETNPWFLGLTGLVSLLHIVFEMLAFKSDVSHWRHKEELTGVSVSQIITNVFVQLVVLLYLIDNNTDTSWMILMGSGMGLLIEAWKITKAVDIKIISSPAGSTFPWKLDITDKHVLSEDEKKTQEYDKLAFRYVSWVAIPCLAIYSVYSLLYESHRGWYSFVISTLTSFVYMFGFAQLVPQLIINYKLKSVAHMPMKAMVYKTLSTVIDDLFAFIIKMPILHRLACFRDDVVFLIFLYQRWIYRVDPKRVNEYGQVMASDADAAVEVDKGGESKKNK
ncbi:cleft lip and palate associated transmembrane protein [Dentipellis sp. KUC8613]|nr:cleft lip and palate associated transmembrane protein [Dentipellis sp. KUC8613]